MPKTLKMQFINGNIENFNGERSSGQDAEELAAEEQSVHP